MVGVQRVSFARRVISSGPVTRAPLPVLAPHRRMALHSPWGGGRRACSGSCHSWRVTWYTALRWSHPSALKNDDAVERSSMSSLSMNARSVCLLGLRSVKLSRGERARARARAHLSNHILRPASKDAQCSAHRPLVVPKRIWPWTAYLRRCTALRGERREDGARLTFQT